MPISTSLSDFVVPFAISSSSCCSAVPFSWVQPSFCFLLLLRRPLNLVLSSIVLRSTIFCSALPYLPRSSSNLVLSLCFALLCFARLVVVLCFALLCFALLCFTILRLTLRQISPPFCHLFVYPLFSLSTPLHASCLSSITSCTSSVSHRLPRLPHP